MIALIKQLGCRNANTALVRMEKRTSPAIALPVGWASDATKMLTNVSLATVGTTPHAKIPKATTLAPARQDTQIGIARRISMIAWDRLVFIMVHVWIG